MLEEGRISTPQAVLVANGAAARTFPASTALTGTLSTTNADSSGGKLVTGTGTLFTTEVWQPGTPNPQQYCYIFSAGLVELMELDYVMDDTHLMLKHKFTTQLGGVACGVVKLKDIFVRGISMAPKTAADTFTLGTPNLAAAVYATTKEYNSLGIIAPVAVKATGSGDVEIAFMI